MAKIDAKIYSLGTTIVRFNLPMEFVDDINIELIKLCKTLPPLSIIKILNLFLFSSLISFISELTIRGTSLIFFDLEASISLGVKGGTYKVSM